MIPRRPSLTQQTISWHGTYLGKVPLSYQHLCMQTIPTVHSKWVIPPEQALWGCSTGLTLCVQREVLNSPTTKAFSILVQSRPWITYYSEGVVLKRACWGDLIRQKRAPIILTLAVILEAVLAGAGTGIAALILQEKNYNSLKADIDQDTQHLEKSISHLECNVNSLAELVLQNRWGLDLVFLKQGGLCAAWRMLFLCQPFWSY